MVNVTPAKYVLHILFTMANPFVCVVNTDDL